MGEDGARDEEPGNRLMSASDMTARLPEGDGAEVAAADAPVPEAEAEAADAPAVSDVPVPAEPDEAEPGADTPVEPAARAASTRDGARVASSRETRRGRTRTARERKADIKERARRREARPPRPGRHATPAARRAELIAAAAAIAAADKAAPEPVEARWAGRRHRGRLVVFAAILSLVIAVAALTTVRRPVSQLARADASYMSVQLIRADQRVRTQLARLKDSGTNRALSRTREAIATTRSLALEVRDSGGGHAERLRRALALEGRWLDAVGSTLANPRSPLRASLRARDGAVRPALAALPSRAGRRTGGARQLVDYAESRVRAGAASRKG
jgi:hypothetical protein